MKDDVKKIVYDPGEKRDLVDVLEFLKKYIKDSQNKKLSTELDTKMKESEIIDCIFNPIFEDYYATKRTHQRLIDKNGKEVAFEEFLMGINEIILKKNPEYKKLLDYVVWSEKRKEQKVKINTEESEEEVL